jgi:hypothetical protein
LAILSVQGEQLRRIVIIVTLIILMAFIPQIIIGSPNDGIIEE